RAQSGGTQAIRFRSRVTRLVGLLDQRPYSRVASLVLSANGRAPTGIAPAAPNRMDARNRRRARHLRNGKERLAHADFSHGLNRIPGQLPRRRTLQQPSGFAKLACPRQIGPGGTRTFVGVAAASLWISGISRLLCDTRSNFSWRPDQRAFWPPRR